MGLVVEDLQVTYHPAGFGPGVRALDGVSLRLETGQALGIVGETGSGKSTLALALMGLVRNASISGQVRFDGAFLPLDEDAAMRIFRWRRIALAFQGAASAFDPVYKIGSQVAEPMLTHLGLSRSAAAHRARQLLEQVGLPPFCFDAYPHQLSGGQNQRAMIAMALSCDPELLILDEPSAGLDVFSRCEMEEMLLALKRERRMSMLVISHNLADITRLADRTLVFYAGQVVESGTTLALLDNPGHPYSWGLVNSYPLMTRTKDLWGIRGEPVDPTSPPAGCRFQPRCWQAISVCQQHMPHLTPGPDGDRSLACHRGGLVTLLRVEGLYKNFARPGGFKIQAVKNASLTVREGEIVGLVGQSGSGKTTLARLVVGLEAPDAGSVDFEDHPLVKQGHRLGLNGNARRIQMIFQNPFEALSARLNVLELVREPLDIQNEGTPDGRMGRVLAALTAVALPVSPGFLSRYSYELSGGQLQRVAIARALILDPRLILADEPVSMLDASEQAKILRLLKYLQNERGMGMLFISHDIALVRKIADRIAVMAAGQIVEFGPSHRILAEPQHPYTRALVERSIQSEGKEVFHV